MTFLDILRLVLLITHFVGLAAIIGPFILQMPRRSGFEIAPILVGSIVQLVSGVGLVAVHMIGGSGVEEPKIVVKLVVAVLVLGCVVGALVVQRAARRTDAVDTMVRPWMLAAGGLAIANIVVAVVWH